MAGAWFGVPVPMEGIYSTSLVLPGCDPVKTEPFALFCAEDRNGCHLEVRRRIWQTRVRAERVDAKPPNHQSSSLPFVPLF